MNTESANHAATARTFTHLVENVTDWDAPTPVPEWRARDVVEHLLNWPVPVLSAWAGLDLTDDPTNSLPERWQQRTEDLQASLENPMVAERTVTDGPFAGQPVRVAIDRAYTADVFMHTWDLAQGTSQRANLDPDRAAELLAGLQSIEDVLRSSGQYGPAHPSNNDDPVDEMMAFIGRDPQWDPSHQ